MWSCPMVKSERKSPEAPGDNGFFYVNFNNPTGTLEVRRFHVAPHSNVADITSTQILSISLSGAANHTGGWIGFGRKPKAKSSVPHVRPDPPNRPDGNTVRHFVVNKSAAS